MSLHYFGRARLHLVLPYKVMQEGTEFFPSWSVLCRDIIADFVLSWEVPAQNRTWTSCRPGIRTDFCSTYHYAKSTHDKKLHHKISCLPPQRAVGTSISPIPVCSIQFSHQKNKCCGFK